MYVCVCVCVCAIRSLLYYLLFPIEPIFSLRQHPISFLLVPITICLLWSMSLVTPVNIRKPIHSLTDREIL